MKSRAQLLRPIRLLLGVVVAGLIVSGLTAFPLLREAATLEHLVREFSFPSFVVTWFAHVHDGLREAYASYPFIGYGTDWLAFGHLVIALFMVGAVIDPVRNIWLIHAGMIACVLVIPIALICGAIRGIPLWWQAIDCSFGILGFIPLWLAARAIRRLPA